MAEHCVVGAGPGGIAAARAFLANGLSVDVVERHTSVGWHLGSGQPGVADGRLGPRDLHAQRLTTGSAAERTSARCPLAPRVAPRPGPMYEPAARGAPPVMIDEGVGAVLVVAAGIAGAILSGVGTLAYVRDVLRGRTVPHRGSWLVWSLIAVVAALAHGADGGTWSLLVLAGQAVGNLVVLALAVRRGIGGLTWGNAVLVGVATLGVLGWMRLGDTTSAVLCAALADGAGLVAIAPKIWADPFSETPATYGLAGATGLLAVLAVPAVEVSLLLFPCYFCIANTATAQLIALRRRSRLRPVGREVRDGRWGRLPRPAAWAARTRYLYAAVLLVLMCSYPSPPVGGWGT